jgi:hypothetical protein
MAPTVLLFLLAPLFGEFLLGNVPATQLYLLPFLAPLYGGGAVLIREAARRTGRGYPTMLVLGAAYAVVEEGLVDQMLFNPGYFTGQSELMRTAVPGLRVDAWLSLIVLAMHAIWSTCIPIVIVESLYANRGSGPWLGGAGLAAMAVVFTGGSVWLGHETFVESGFLATPWQLGLAAVLVVALTVVAFAVIGPDRTLGRARTPRPAVVVAVTAFASSLYMLTEELAGWWRVAACLVLAAGFFWLFGRWSGSSQWSSGHTLAAATGGVLTYAWLGAVMEPETGPKSLADHVGTGVLVVVVAGLLVLARTRLAATGRLAQPTAGRTARSSLSIRR